MLYAYRPEGDHLQRLPEGAPLAQAVWIDLFDPTPAEVAALADLGITVPDLADMEEIEISNRLYREQGYDFMTVVLPGQNAANEQISAPVTFILGPQRLISVRHHRPRPFETYPTRADKVGPGCSSATEIMLGLFEDIVGRLADHLENVGRILDEGNRSLYAEATPPSANEMEQLLRRIGRHGDLVGKVRVALLTLERALGFRTLMLDDAPQAKPKDIHAKASNALLRDIKSLEVHADFHTNRIAVTNDVILGLITISQSQTTKTVSVVAVIFLPPTLIASVYGMNFKFMPELEWLWGYPAAIGLMVGSAIGTMAFFKWRRWL